MLQHFLCEVAISLVLAWSGAWWTATVFILLHAAHRLVVAIGE